MPELHHCSHCQHVVSRVAHECPKCGLELNAIPEAITAELLGELLDGETNTLFRYVTQILSTRGCYNLGGPRCVEVLAELPHGLRAIYTMVLLDSEVRNGGFYQFFTNLSGQLAQETLEDLSWLGAPRHLELVQRAVALNERIESEYPSYKNRWEPQPSGVCALVEPGFWSDVEQNFEPEFDRLSDEFYELEDADSLWKLVIRDIRTHPEHYVHSRKQSA